MRRAWQSSLRESNRYIVQAGLPRARSFNIAVDRARSQRRNNNRDIIAACRGRHALRMGRRGRRPLHISINFTHFFFFILSISFHKSICQFGAFSLSKKTLNPNVLPF